ncbi:MAG: response regulator [Pseudomonadota bacterium]
MLKIFIIEDAPSIRSQLIETLQSYANIKVVGFADGQREALQQLRTIEWDMAIVDIGLRDGNGLAILEALQKDQVTYGLRIVFSNYPSPALKARCLALGAIDFFDKSREFSELIDCVKAKAY